MNGTERARILMVDDEERVLEAMRRNLRTHFDITTTTSGAEALDILEYKGPFAVLVSDLRMPGTGGLAVLRQARKSAPDTARVLLTGKADLESAIAIVNEGAIFRFLSKPCSPELLRNTLEAAVEQNRLVTAERVLLEQTLRRSVKAFTDILALVSPAAFGRAMRAHTVISRLAKQCAIARAWPVEMAAMLSQIGCVVLPPQTLDKVYHGVALREDERGMVERIPALVEELLGNIPRLEPVREILRYQQKNYGGGGSPNDSVRGEEIPWGSRALRVVLDHDVLEAQGMPPSLALDTLRGRLGCYDPAIIESLAWVRGGAHEASPSLVRELQVGELKPCMVFAADAKTVEGVLLVARGQEVTCSLMERLRNYDSEVGVKQPLRIVVRDPSTQDRSRAGNGGRSPVT